jgi:hypothetical protein
MTEPHLTPLQLVDFGKAVLPNHLHQALYENHNRDVFLGILQFLRDSAYPSLAESMKAQREGKSVEAAYAAGSFDGLSQVIVKLNALALAPPEIEE